MKTIKQWLMLIPLTILSWVLISLLAVVMQEGLGTKIGYGLTLGLFILSARQIWVYTYKVVNKDKQTVKVKEKGLSKETKEKKLKSE